jgi:predicted Zn-dependent protease
MQDIFYAIADHAVSLLKSGEIVTLNFEGEQSDFVRFNHNKVRQPGSVAVTDLSIDLIHGQRHAESQLSLSGVADEDRGRVRTVIDDLRGRLDHLPEDPHLLYATEVRSTERVGKNELPRREQALADIMAAGEGKDLVGIFAQGAIYRGFANSLGQKNWFATFSYHLDWSFYLRADKAVKSTYAGFQWNPQDLRQKMAAAGEQLGLLDREPKTIKPGKYRVYLAPRALEEIFGLLSWGGLGLKSHKSKIASLIKMSEGGETVSPDFTFSENTAGGIAPNFDAKGFIKPDEVVLIEGGRFKNYLVSPRSAKEYGVPTNGAAPGEGPQSMDLAAGKIPMAEVAAKLGTGAYVNNLWYLNYSDRPACRMTGMTRFATFWVEDGRIVAPLNVMRFDESFYRMFGANLLGLTREREMILASETYGGRNVGSARLPGALIEDFAFTL